MDLAKVFMCAWPDQRKIALHFGNDLDYILHSWLSCYVGRGLHSKGAF